MMRNPEKWIYVGDPACAAALENEEDWAYIGDPDREEAERLQLHLQLQELGLRAVDPVDSACIQTVTENLRKASCSSRYIDQIRELLEDMGGQGEALSSLQYKYLGTLFLTDITNAACKGTPEAALRVYRQYADWDVGTMLQGMHLNPVGGGDVREMLKVLEQGRQLCLQEGGELPESYRLVWNGSPRLPEKQE